MILHPGYAVKLMECQRAFTYSVYGELYFSLRQNAVVNSGGKCLFSQPFYEDFQRCGIGKNPEGMRIELSFK